ncbi:hypothetical protein WMF31_13685 [Sorangium sp. So ce1036]|uniref:hypothetical protein n=1 Tax=Sorangium sp. So ce1036 TaxID=3133328 RepID=UPI003F121DF0
MIIGEKLAIACGEDTVTLEKNGNVTVQGKRIAVKGEGPIRAVGRKLDVKSEGAVNVEASGKVKVKDSNVGMNRCGLGRLHLEMMSGSGGVG